MWKQIRNHYTTPGRDEHNTNSDADHGDNSREMCEITLTGQGNGLTTCGERDGHSTDDPQA